ncbi:sugar kinase [Microbacterium lacus]|uniref:Sugar kinase n=1 Tax=Microbacterium lacus TaxID=415217 RepID=A0ABN2HF96_9MICO
MNGGLLTLGETMALLRPTAPLALEHANELAIGVGGAESNVAIGVARLGLPSAWIGRVGDDALGRRVLRELRGESVEVHARVEVAAPTGLMIKEPVAQVTRVRYHRYGSAGSMISPEDVDEGMVRLAGVVHVTGITPAISSSAAEAVDRLIDLAHAFRVPVSFDVNHRSFLWRDRDPSPVYRRLAAKATIVFAGVEEAELLVGEGSPADLSRRLSQLGPGQAIVKLGSRGCVSYIDGNFAEVPAIGVTVVDTVGAGDAFVAGYLTGFLEGRSAAERVDLAVRCGAFACLGPGDWESSPHRSQLELLNGLGDPVLR